MIGGMTESHNWELDHTPESLSSVHISDVKTSCRYPQNARLDPEYPLPAPIPWYEYYFFNGNPATQQAPKPHFLESIDSQVMLQAFMGLIAFLIDMLEGVNGIMGDIS
ncbi:hypothetical protein N7501_010506 [Penicillium viridicatum]|nr:hypothetical protein N7501_010506 [Penicillium viridicatum]